MKARGYGGLHESPGNIIVYSCASAREEDLGLGLGVWAERPSAKDGFEDGAVNLFELGVYL